jgi:hypothetical protein
MKFLPDFQAPKNLLALQVANTPPFSKVQLHHHLNYLKPSSGNEETQPTSDGMCTNPAFFPHQAEVDFSQV